jgi:hypothetical protein
MIGQHPELVGLPELKLFCYPTIGELAASLPPYWIERGARHRSPGLVRAVAHFEFGGQDSIAIARAQSWLGERPEWTGADVFDVLMTHASPRTTVEKSPENVESDEALARLVTAYPRARYLHLTRHPLTTLRSAQEHWARTIPDHTMPGEPMSILASWADTQCRILRLARALPAERYLCLKAEDVLNSIRPHLRSIATWLGVRTDEDAIDAMMHPEASPFASAGSVESGVAGGLDPKFLRDPTPHPVEAPRGLNQPPGWVENASLWRGIVDVACRLGYQ